MAAKIPDVNTMIQMGINPKNNLPLKMGKGGNNCTIKGDTTKLIRIIDEQDAITRYTWFNIPMNLSSLEIERLLYYRGSLSFFMLDDGSFYLMPYALDGTLDFYGRFNTIHPVPITDSGNKNLRELLSSTKRDVIYGIVDDDILTIDHQLKSAVILNDYTPQMAQSGLISRQVLNNPICNFEADCFAYMNTAMMASTGVKGVRVSDMDSKDDVLEGANEVSECAKTAKIWVPMLGTIDFQDLGDGATYKTEDYLIAMQAIDNFRKSTYGIDKKGLIEKDAYVNVDQVNKSSGSTAPLTDGLLTRQNFCNIVNSIWGLGIWCEISETIKGAPQEAMSADDSSQNTGGHENDTRVQPETI